MTFVELNDIAKGKGFPVFDNAEFVVGICAEGQAANFSNKDIKKLTEWMQRPQIGAKGLVYVKVNEDGTYKSIPQTGNVILEDNVDVGAGTTIDRATLGSTILRRGVKLDNQIQIAHNVEIGENTAIAAQTGVAGSTKIGKNCLIGGQVGIVGHITIGDRVRIQAQSGIGRNVKDDEVLQGSPALNYGDYNKSYVHFKNLPKIVNKINEIDKGNNGK